MVVGTGDSEGGGEVEAGVAWALVGLAIEGVTSQGATEEAGAGVSVTSGHSMRFSLTQIEPDTVGDSNCGLVPRLCHMCVGFISTGLGVVGGAPAPVMPSRSWSIGMREEIMRYVVEPL